MRIVIQMSTMALLVGMLMVTTLADEATPPAAKLGQLVDSTLQPYKDHPHLGEDAAGSQGRPMDRRWPQGAAHLLAGRAWGVA